LTNARIVDLIRSHDELRAAAILAGKEIRKLNFGKKDSPVLRTLRTVHRQARIVRKAATAAERAASPGSRTPSARSGKTRGLAIASTSPTWHSGWVSGDAKRPGVHSDYEFPANRTEVYRI